LTKRKKQKCPHPQCEGGFIYQFRDLPDTKQDRNATALPAVEVTRTLCPICQGLSQIRRKR
jgi:hypothetical protein